MERINTRHTALMAMLIAVGLIIFSLESLIPPLTPIPGIKLGLANIVTLFTLYAFSGRDAVCVLILRILLASVFAAGQVVSLWYSLAGGILCLIAMNICKLFLNENYMQFTSVVGAVFHNLGQLTVAVLITGTPGVLWYSPMLMLGGVICGFFTGIACKLMYKRVKNILKL
ncbi:MAG: Gx transporter family protein [Clostridiales bacterium]|nr:Gx transporter family protein [Clostridiales bacterium]